MLTTYEKINMKWYEQGYDAKLYIKLLVMRDLTFIYTLLETWFKKTFMKIFIDFLC
jgi:hypothetical protein